MIKWLWALILPAALAAPVGPLQYQLAGYTSTVTTQAGTTYTLTQNDCGTLIRFTNAAAVTLTLPNSLTVGCPVSILQTTAAGVVTLSGSFVSRSSFTKTAGTNALIGVWVDTNVGGTAAHYIMTGDGA